MPTPMPMLACTVRLKMSGPDGSGGSPIVLFSASCAASRPVSYAMAALMTGSAKMRANRNASSPAKAPARMPRPMSFLSTSVAGEAEEVPRVVDELVDGHVVAEHRGHALVDADEVV